MNSDATTTNSGSVFDVAAFFRVHPQTIRKWMRESGDKRIGYFQMGGTITFGEEDVIDRWVSCYAAGRRLQPGEAREIARREWREHLKLRREITLFELLEERIVQLEEALGPR